MFGGIDSLKSPDVEGSPNRDGSRLCAYNPALPFSTALPSWPPETQKSYQLVSVSQTIGLASFIDLEHSSCRNIEQREQEPYMR